METFINLLHNHYELSWVTIVGLAVLAGFVLGRLRPLGLVLVALIAVSVYFLLKEDRVRKDYFDRARMKVEKIIKE